MGLTWTLGVVGSGATVIQPLANVFRAPTDNDGLKLLSTLRNEWGLESKAEQNWRSAGLHERPAEDFIRHTMSQRTLADGAVEFEHTFSVPEGLDLPRVGVMFTVAEHFTQWRWYGRGPHENYPDRKSSAIVGIHNGNLDELPYIVPQEFGLRMDCRWIELLSADSSHRLRIEAEGGTVFHASVTWHTPQQLYAARDVTELERSSVPVVCLDVAHRGLGTASCGPDVLPKYLVAPGNYRLTYTVSTFS